MKGQKDFALINIISDMMIGTMIIIIVVAIVMNRMQERERRNEDSAIHSINSIVKSEMVYLQDNNDRQFADWSQLTDSRRSFLDPQLAHGEKDGYRFSVTVGISKDGWFVPYFDIMAQPIQPDGMWITGHRSFYTNESLKIFERQGGVPPKAEFPERWPPEGIEFH